MTKAVSLNLRQHVNCTFCPASNLLFDSFQRDHHLEYRISLLFLLFLFSSPVYDISVRHREKKRMTTFGEDMVAFSKMTDHVYHQILHGGDELQDAANILRRLERRELYRCLCETKPRSYTEEGVVSLSYHTFASLWWFANNAIQAEISSCILYCTCW